MSDLTQDQRLISISSPLAKDELLLGSFDGAEYISDLFEFKIQVVSKNHSIQPQQLIGKPITITVQDKNKRSFNGFVSEFVFGESTDKNLRIYHLTMVPWLWFLSKTHNNRIFQEKTTREIVIEVFQDLGFNDFDFLAEGNKKPREYCVQFNESDLNFVSRLLEEDGIAYFFAHQDDAHILKIVDDNQSFPDCKETDLTYSQGSHLAANISRWEHAYAYRKGVWTLNDYNFQEPSKVQLKSTTSISKFAKVGQYEHYQYSHYHDFAGLQTLTKKRIEAEETPLDTVDATSDCSTFHAGGKFKLSSHPDKQEQGKYIISKIRHRAFESSYVSGHEGGSGYSNDFSCIPEKTHFRPSLRHQKPLVQGPQSALVVGPSGEEIYIDTLGRIKVQFHWDRQGKKNEKSSCFMRVMQPWAGQDWGTSFIPRIGMEVVVNFYNGDPDRPVVTGSVYNGNNAPPFSSKTQSGIRTRSTKEGSSSNCNELRFDDSKGSEQIFIHAEKNMDTEVENDETLSVDHDRTKTISNDETSSIGNNRSKSVGVNQSESIGKSKSIDVGENHSESIGKNKTLNVGGNHTESIANNASIDIGDNLSQSVGKDMTIDVGKDSTQNAGKNVAIIAGDSITLKTGSASIVMKKNGDITIKGKNVTVQGSGKINIKASSSVAIKGSKVTTN